MENNKKFVLGFFLALAVLLVNFATADSWTEPNTPDISSLEIYVNGALRWYGSCNYNTTTSLWDCSTFDMAIPAIERGEKVSIKTIFMAGNDIDNVKVKAEITGYHEDIEAETSFFDVFANSSYTKTLNLEVPNDMDEGECSLYIKIKGRSSLSGIDEAEIGVMVQRVAELVEILSVEVYGDLEAGGTFYVDVVVKNRGSDEVEDVYVSASIAELGLSRTLYLGDLGEVDDDDDDTKKVTFALTLPETAKAGSYQLKIRAYSSKTATERIKSIAITGKTIEEGKIVITPKATKAKLEKGKGVAYVMTIANYGSETVEVKIETQGTEGWATTQVTPQTFSLAAGETETVSIYVVANEDAIAAEHLFSVTVNYNGNTEQISLSADVVEESTTPQLKTILTVVAIALAVAIIVLLIILLTRKEPKQVEETYY